MFRIVGTGFVLESDVEIWWEGVWGWVLDGGGWGSCGGFDRNDMIFALIFDVMWNEFRMMLWMVSWDNFKSCVSWFSFEIFDLILEYNFIFLKLQCFIWVLMKICIIYWNQ